MSTSLALTVTQLSMHMGMSRLQLSTPHELYANIHRQQDFCPHNQTDTKTRGHMPISPMR